MMQQQMISTDNYEEFFFLAADGELNEAQQQALRRFLQQHPELAAEYNELASLKFVPDEALVYEDRASLLKPVTKSRVISLSAPWKALAAAASISLLLWAGVHISPSGQQGSIGNIVTALAKIPARPSLTTSAKPVSATTARVALPRLAAAPPAHTVHHSQTVEYQTSLSTAAKQADHDNDGLAVLQPSLRSTVVEARPPQPALALIEVPAGMKVKPAPTVASVKGGLHFATENRAAVQVLKNAAVSTLDRISNSPYRLWDIAINLKLGGKTFSINF